MVKQGFFGIQQMLVSTFWKDLHGLDWLSQKLLASIWSRHSLLLLIQLKTSDSTALFQRKDSDFTAQFHHDTDFKARKQKKLDENLLSVHCFHEQLTQNYLLCSHAKVDLKVKEKGDRAREGKHSCRWRVCVTGCAPSVPGDNRAKWLHQPAINAARAPHFLAHRNVRLSWPKTV